MVACACRHTRQRSKNRSGACEGTHKKNCTAEVHGRNKEKKTAQSHDIALQTRQRQFIKNLLKLKKIHLHPSTTHTLERRKKNEKNEKKMKKIEKKIEKNRKKK
ncbi:hypothetical protein TCDM_12911 [Trypanosoma cruzi Dm28c]|uniref:Uncharacterized protein n=1 Tax=Trypanosoma cruzi Dm28c TaxID=1416333 RepID=V5CJS3_TRYCR|nr:hypothetical protein TCDM_12911 [Trypanosoma cruzi Dm28c]